jgi:putative methionine-R-sulfoxide reductase with GAF domain
MEQSAKRDLFAGLERQIRDRIAVARDGSAMLQTICEMLAKAIPYYDWVGFYLVDCSTPGILLLGPYSGAPTEHTRIEFGRGICGQAAERRETFVVQDVAAETNYLSCSIHVKAEIVVPILRDGVVLGELDIDSHTLAPFDHEDERFLSSIAEAVSRLLP